MKTPILIPIKLKLIDFIRLLPSILLVITSILISVNVATAQIAMALHPSEFIEHSPGITLFKTSAISVSFDKYNLDSIFAIEIPDYLVEVNDIDDRASLQFKNIFNETYLMVIIEKKSIDGHTTLDQLQEHFELNLLVNGGLLLNSKSLFIDQHQAIQNKVEWVVNELPMSYCVTFIDTPAGLYKIYGWTLASQQAYLKDFAYAANSFHFIKSDLH